MELLPYFVFPQNRNPATLLQNEIGLTKQSRMEGMEKVVQPNQTNLPSLSLLHLMPLPDSLMPHLALCIGMSVNQHRRHHQPLLAAPLALRKIKHLLAVTKKHTNTQPWAS